MTEDTKRKLKKVGRLFTRDVAMQLVRSAADTLSRSPLVQRVAEFLRRRPRELP